MARSFNLFVVKIAATVREIGASAYTVAHASETLTSTAIQIMVSAKATSMQSGHAVEAADEVASEVRALAAGTSSMDAGLQRIAGTAGEAAEVCTRSLEAARATRR